MALTFSKNKLLLTAAWSVCVAIVALAIAGAVGAYSPVPFWDMWDGYLSFFLAVGDGNASAWWGQQNEHRIFLSHLLFWADLQWFGGGPFLIICNYLLLGAVVMLFWRMLRARLADMPASTAQTVLAVFITAWLFSWMQEENLTWGFQSQFILAQLLPLGAFYALHLSLRDDGARYFTLACVCGLAAIGSMANGILALPMLLVYAVATRQGRRRCVILAALSVVGLAAFLHGYQVPSDHPSVLQTLQRSPGLVLQYVLRYVGSPFYYLAGGERVGRWLATLAGGIAISTALWHTLRWLRKDRDTLVLALLFFIAYIGATALGTAAGRLYLGAGQVFASRYTTPALMLWAALLLLWAPWLLRAAGMPRRRLLVGLPFVLLGVAMLAFQAHAPGAHRDQVFQKKIAGLALELGVADQPQVQNVYPSVTVILPLAARARAHGLTIFGMTPWRGQRERLGQPVAPPPALTCQGSMDAVAPVEGDANYLRVSGWLHNPQGAAVPSRVRFVDAGGKLVGVALSGRSRADAAAAIGKKNARQAGFQGYVLASVAGSTLSMQADVDSGACALPVRIPPALLTMTSVAPDAKGVTGLLDTTAVLPGNTWPGGDYDHTVMAGMQVYGSFVHADSDTGAISLRVKRGDRLLYRSGPGGARQVLSLPGSGLPDLPLPARHNWALLEFSGAALPDGEFTVTFTDAGDGWGEWSAIAVRK